MTEAQHAGKTSDTDEQVIADNPANLINPASGIANDYLNLFNEVVMLIEQLPGMPELIDDLKAWRPTTYQDYFLSSPLPGSVSALESYEKLDKDFRASFEEIVADLDLQATGIVATIRLHYRAKEDRDPDGLAAICERGGNQLRATLDKAVAVVNEGIRGLEKKAREREERLINVRVNAIAAVEEFYSKPIWRSVDEDDDMYS